MKEAIKYLKTLGIKCDANGTVLSKLPDGQRGIALVDMLEDHTMNADEECCFTIIMDKVTKIDV